MMQESRSQWGTPPWRRVASVGMTMPDAKVSTPDVAIVGGGLTGVSTAYHLAKMGVHAAVFEAELVGDGASGRTGGLVLEGTAAGILDQVNTCVAGLERLVNDENIDCDLKLPGCWEIEHRKKPGARMLPWSDDGRAVAIARIVPGGVVEPAALTIGIAKSAIKLESLIYERARVSRINTNGELFLEIRNQRIAPKYVVIATNAWIDAKMSRGARLHSSLTFACATESLNDSTLKAVGLGENIPFYTCDTPYLWGRTTSDGRLIFGSGLVFSDPTEIENINIREGSPFQIGERLQKRVRDLHPALFDVRIDTFWGGPIAFTEDSVPLLGVHPDNKHLLVAGAYAGHGVALSVRVGELLALAIAQNQKLPEWGSLAR
jgi:gamma-glutamylputrescine oxidase